MEAQPAGLRATPTSPPPATHKRAHGPKKRSAHGKHHDGMRMIDLGRRHRSDAESSDDDGDNAYMEVDRMNGDDGEGNRHAPPRPHRKHHVHHGNAYHDSYHHPQQHLNHRQPHQEKLKVSAVRRDYLNEGEEGERDHLLMVQAVGSPQRHKARSGDSSPAAALTPASPLIPASPMFPPFPLPHPHGSAAISTFSTFTTTSTTADSTTTTTASSYSVSFIPPSNGYDPSPSSSLSSSSSSLGYSPPPSPRKKGSAKKKVTWVDELDGTQLEEVIEVERYLKQRGSLAWYVEMMMDHKAYFLLLAVIALIFVVCLVFILYKLVF